MVLPVVRNGKKLLIFNFKIEHKKLCIQYYMITDDPNIYSKSVLTQKVMLTPSDLQVKSKSEVNDNIDRVIKRILIDQIEGKCSKDGYVKQDSVSIIKRSTGQIKCNQFTGDVHYNVMFSCIVCNPVKGQEITCTVKNTNKMGLLAESGPMNIIVAYEHLDEGIRDIFKTIVPGSKIIVRIVGKRININDQIISVVAKVIGVVDN